jgi:hypothetical protein
MSKVTKRSIAVATARTESGQLRSLAARRELAARAGEANSLIEGRVIELTDGDGEGAVVVRALLAGGEGVEALCPAHVDAGWLRAACAVAPVPAAFVVARPSGRHVLWGIFPGAAHADVRADLVIRGRAVTVDADSLALSSRDAHLRLQANGDVALKGRDVTSHARRVNRIKGGSIRLN